MLVSVDHRSTFKKHEKLDLNYNSQSLVEKLKDDKE